MSSSSIAMHSFFSILRRTVLFSRKVRLVNEDILAIAVCELRDEILHRSQLQEVSSFNFKQPSHIVLIALLIQ